MKAVILIISLVLSSFSGVAMASPQNSVEKLLPNIRDRVRHCTVMPYHMDLNHVRVEHSLQSHCPEVKVLPVINHQVSAKIRVAGHQFIATLVETEYTDGDFFDVEIRDLTSNDSYRIYNALAFGDVLLGVLDGNTKGVTANFVHE
jgi:hypothetical protein